MDGGEPHRPPEPVTEGDARDASTDRRQQRGPQMKMTVAGQRARNGHQELVRDWQAENPEHLREEQDDRAVAREPVQQPLLHPVVLADTVSSRLDRRQPGPRRLSAGRRRAAGWR